MSSARATAAFALLLSLLLLAVALPGTHDDPTSLRPVAAFVPDHPWAQRLAERADALANDDWEALIALAAGDDPAALLAAEAVAAAPAEAVTPAVRLAMLTRVAELRPDEPLARAGALALALATGRAAEAAGEREAAVAAYREALPDDEAIAALRRNLLDPYALANALLQGGAPNAALTALDGRAAPSLEAPALRTLGRHEQALAAYLRWADQVPDSAQAAAGIAWSLWSLDRVDEAEAAFLELPEPDRSYGLGLVANRRGEIGPALDFLEATGQPARLWLATTLAERHGRLRDAVRLYLRLAEGNSVYADDAAWRARVLAQRLGDASLAAEAEARIPSGSYFDLLLGGEVRTPARDDLPRHVPDGYEALRWAAAVHDLEAARLVGIFGLRAATAAENPEAAGVAWAEALVALGEYREPMRFAVPLVTSGSEELRTWRLAYPQAWPELVRTEAERASIDPEIVWAVMRRESAFYPRAVSRSGAQGLMQVMPPTWDWLAELVGEAPGDPFDVTTNVRYGTHYLGWLQRYFGGDLELAVASYNRGQGYIRRLYEGEVVAQDRDEWLRFIDALETREYLQAVWVTYHIYQELGRIEAGERPLRSLP